ncbi:hypothetical protein [Paenibacillus sp. Marseille-Q7038]
MKIVKEAAMYAVVIFVFNLILELLFDQREFFEHFEKKLYWKWGITCFFLYPHF